MFTQLYSRLLTRSKSNLSDIQYLFIIRSWSHFQFVKRVTVLYDQQRYRELLHLFDMHHENSAMKFVSNKAIIQILQACDHSQNVQMMKKVHQMFSSRIANDPYLLSKLIHVYMNIGDLPTVENLYATCPSKAIAVQGAMMKGYITNNKPLKAIQLFEQIANPNEICFTLLFNACAKMASPNLLNIVLHAFNNIPPSFFTHPRLLTCLIDAFVSCGDFATAESIFANRIVNKSLHDYAVMMKGHIKNEEPAKAIELFDQIQNPDDVLWIIAFNACAQMNGEDVKDLVNKWSMKLSDSSMSNPRLVTSLIDALMNSGEVTAAQRCFDKVNRKTTEMFGAMMKGYTKNGEPRRAIYMFHQVQHPNDVIWALFFHACGAIGTEDSLKVLRSALLTTSLPLDENPRLLSSLMDALISCHDIDFAESLFQVSINKTVELVSIMMKGYIKQMKFQKAMDLFQTITNPNEIAISLLFNACGQLMSADALQIIHRISRNMPSSFYANPSLVTSLIEGLMKCGDVTAAELIFKRTNTKSPHIYAVMMKGYIKNGHSQEAIELFGQIQNPDDVLWIIAFNACAQMNGEDVKDLVNKWSMKLSDSSMSNPRLVTSLIDALMNSGQVTTAELVFRKSIEKPLQMFGAMMKGYTKNNQASKAIDLYHKIESPDEAIHTILFLACAQVQNSEAYQLITKISSNMPQQWMKNVRLMTCVMDAFIKCGDCNNAEKFFNQIEKTVISYGNLMNAFNQANQPEKTLMLFNQMKTHSIEPNSVIYLLLIKALSRISMASLAEEMLQQIPIHFHTEPVIRNALIGLWTKTGCIDRAREIFDNIPQPDRFAYGLMINGYGLNGKTIEALTLFHQVPSETIDDMIYICILNACSHGGFVDQAQMIFDQIEKKSDKIYTAMIDALSRAALFGRAQALIHEFECKHPPNHVMYMALLSGTRNHNNSQLAEVIVNRMKTVFVELPNTLTSASILLSNIYGSTGDIEKASDIKLALMRSGAKKKIGASWTAPDGNIFKFCAHDRTHPRANEIYAELERISAELIHHGYQYDTSSITRSLHEDETVASALCGHSEKLAIAWNFVVNPKIKRIEVTKNLRICRDCHQSTKLLAQIRNCEFLIRDANRFHHISSDGHCSCNDYF